MSTREELPIDEIAEAIVEHGWLTKERIVETWGLTDADYTALQQRLDRDRRLERGPRGTGGFVARRRRRSEEEGGTSPSPLTTAVWERVAVGRIEEVLRQSELEELIGSLESGIRNARRIRTGEDRPSRKRELAMALVLQHGIDLFSSVEVRRAVAKSIGIQCPDRWHPGKIRARQFVEEAGFPGELVGLPSPESMPDMEFLEGRFRLHPLRPFQKEVQRGLLETLQEPLGRRCIVTLPTGGGKTRVAVESISYWQHDHYDRERGRAQQGTVLWLAHTEELCEQACACFRQVWEGSDNVCPTTLVRFWGNHTKDLAEHQRTLRDVLQRPAVIVSTPQRIAGLIEGRARGAAEVLESFVRALGLIVVDEAHRAAAPTYRRIVERLAKTERPVSVIGLTATPFRMEYVGDDPERGTRDLKAIFHKIVEPRRTLGEEPRLTLEEMRVLARPEFETIETGTRIRIPDPPTDELLSEGEMERIDRVLALRADNAPRRMLVLARIVSICADPSSSVLYFGPSVRDSECMAFLLRESGIRAAVVSGTTRDVTRRTVVSDFKEGNLQVLCNCEVLTTGFDAPRVTHVVIARPTVSRVLYEQIVGRGLRGPEFGGTEACAVIDCEDQFRGERPPLGYESFRAIWYARRGRKKTAES
jgi:superfamily II DNA or RNA helicase